ncbi:MAG: AzlC family ABC transporter permease [Lachnospiraceae bacterium]|nr:AzlC family ABC transporter permease [Lachnospiraceae bacterium]
MNLKEFKEGLRDGVPIGLGYLSVSFTFGIMAVTMGFYWWQAALISMTCLTSAGQFAGISIMTFPAHYIEMLISQLTINLRYSFMSVSLAQKTSDKFKGIFRWIFGFIITDEIYAVAVSRKEISRSYFFALGIIPYIGWATGTITGALLGSVLPQALMSALSVAIYAMFIAIVVPDMKGNKAISIVVAIAVILSSMFYYIPGLNKVPTGITISVCAIVSALIGAVLFPIEEEKESVKE